MKKQDEFYIGWKEEMPKSNSTFLKKILIPLFILIPFLMLAMVLFQKSFAPHKFEFGKIKKITGVYYDIPTPMLIADRGILPDSLATEIVLVGYGKLGARGIIRNIEKTKGNLHGKKITIEGTLIYGDGKTLMELTKEENTSVEIVDQSSASPPSSPPLKAISLNGEIIDPKCYFGVMKPGEGKVHKSCAIRCISGGIPPVLKVKTSGQKNAFQYYLLFDEQGHEINKQVLPFVAESIELTGKTHRFFNWDILYVNVDDLKLLEL